MQRLFGAVCGLGIGVAAGACAQSTAHSTPAVVVELYTSQGCSACPPADHLMTTLADDPRVIALALHVDYWDYIGWEDNFGQAAFTGRQKDYARAVGSRMLYTPQFIVGGQDRVEGNQPDRVASLVDRHAETAAPMDLTLVREGDMVRITAAPAETPGPVDVQLVRYTPESSVDIDRGENAGKTIDYRNIVTSWQMVQAWDRSEALDIAVPAPGGDPIVVIVQMPGKGPILAAARLD